MKQQFRPLIASLLLAGSAMLGAAAHAADKLTVQLDWLPGGDKSFVYAGLKEGFFAAEGLDVTILPGRGSADAITKVATGAADVGFGGISALMMAAAEGGVPVKAVMRRSLARAMILPFTATEEKARLTRWNHNRDRLKRKNCSWQKGGPTQQLLLECVTFGYK